MYETKEEKEKVILVKCALSTENDIDIRNSIDELEELANTAGAKKVGEIIQVLPKFNNASYIGSGKLLELKELVDATGADTIICDDELTPSQADYLSEATGVKCIDRTVLILDIFALHATTDEGKIQVGIAQMNYALSHLSGSYKKLSRLGGGIGTRGPGEQKIETDRRIIRNRISELRRQLKEKDVSRHNTRKKRLEGSIKTVAIVGYTNAGKSTLLNRLTDAGVLSEDKLFATLDPVTRKYKYEDGEEVLFSDTVGFVRRLPHFLVDAFRTTLMEAEYADLILIVGDASDPDLLNQLKVVNETLGDLGIEGIRRITAFNKIDLLDGNAGSDIEEKLPLKELGLKKEDTVYMSAASGKGVDTLLAKIRETLHEGSVEIDMVLPYDKASKVQLLREKGHLKSEEYLPEGIHITGSIDRELEYLLK